MIGAGLQIVLPALPEPGEAHRAAVFSRDVEWSVMEMPEPDEPAPKSPSTKFMKDYKVF